MSRRRERSRSLGARITSAMVALAALVLAISGALLYLLQQRETRARVDEALQRSVEELRVFSSGVDPETNQPFTSVYALLGVYLRRTVAAETESEMGFVGTTLAWEASADVTVRPERDPELLAALEGPLQSGSVTLGTTETSVTTWRWVVVPVAFSQDAGAAVRVYDMRAELAPLNRSVAYYALMSSGILLAAVAVSILTMRGLLRPIERLRIAAESIDRRDLSARVPTRGRDDLARLSRAMNQMLDRLEEAMTAQKDLLNDVGHELRTPITIVRGHLELIDAGDPEDVESARRPVIAELDRMGALLNDLIMLAAAREIDFITPTPTPLADLVVEIFEKMRALGDRQWRLGNVVDITIDIDPVRITQALLQLAANAVKYSGEGSSISLGAERRGHEVGISIRDQGVGISQGDLETIRLRFARGSNAAQQAKGSGLGLSIVESIVTAHGGRLEIASEFGKGSTFTIVLPLTDRLGADH